MMRTESHRAQMAAHLTWLPRKQRALEACGAAALYCLLLLIATYPAIRHWSTQMMGGSWDTGQNIWNFWWVRQSVQQGDFLPYFTQMLYFPNGVSLAYHPLALYNAYQAVFLQEAAAFSLPAAFNTIAALSFLVSALTAYWLVKRLTQNAAAAFAAGLLFAFSPAHMSRLHFGHLEVFTSAQFLPLIALAAMCAGQTLQRRWTLLAAFLLAVTGWQSLQMALGAAMFASLILLLFGSARTQWRKLLIEWFLLAGLASVLLLPVVYPMLRDFADFYDPADASAGYILNSSDLLDFFVPDAAVSTFWRGVLNAAGEQSATGFFQLRGQRTAFLGLSTILLCLTALFVGTYKLTWRWWTVAIAFFVLALGPVLQVGGHVLPVPLPYALFLKIPILGLGRVPARFGIFVMLALAVIVGYCIDELSRRTQRRFAVGAFVSALVVVELVAIPMRMDNRLLTMPTFYSEIALPAPALSQGSVLDVPYDLVGAVGPACDYMVYQIVHQRPIVSGYISRTPQSAIHMLDNYPFVRQLRARLYDDKTPIAFSREMILQGRQELEALQVEYVVLHKTLLPDEDTQLITSALMEVIGAPIYENEQIRAWRLS